MTGAEFVLWGILNFWLIVIGTIGVAFVITCLVNIHELFDELKTSKPLQVSKQELINDDDDGCLN